MSNPLFTYRNGKKLNLKKRLDCFVIRALSKDLKDAGLPQGEQLSTASTRVIVPQDELETTMARARGIAPTHHAYQTLSSSEDFLITDRVFISFHQKISEDEMDRLAGKYGLWKIERFSSFEYLYQLSNSTGMNPTKLVVKLTEDESQLINMVEHDLNYTVTPYQPFLPTDPSYPDQWHLHTRSTHELFDKRSSSYCEQAWELLGNFGSSQVVVGVTDDGCNIDHHDFNSPGKFAGWGYYEGITLITSKTVGANPDKMYEAGHNHGTSCAGVIAGEADAELTVGAAPGCRLLPLKWPSSEGGGLWIGDTRLIKMLDFVKDKVDILSNSWGSSPRSNVNSLVKNKIAQLAKNGGRRKKGILFLWAAGNENCPIEHSSSIDIPYTNGIKKEGNQYFWVGVKTAKQFRHNLVGVPGVMYVAALASSARRSHYSNYGTGIDICAPSSNSHSYWRGSAPGLSITTTSGGMDTDITPSFGGTSSATPLTAGIAALIISANPELTALEIADILKSTASKDLDTTPYSKTPPASYDTDTSWDVSPAPPFDDPSFQDINSDQGTWSPWFGYGRVDAFKAVEQAKEAGNPIREIRIVQDDPQEIPDNSRDGIVSQIKVPQEGIIQDLRIRLDISHTYIGDLFVSLEGPGGQTISLHNRKGKNQDDLKVTLTGQNVAGIQSLFGTSIKGTWKLKIADHAGWDKGRLNRWALLAEVL